MARWRILRPRIPQLMFVAALLCAVSICGVAEESARPEMKAEVYQTWPFDAAEAKRRQEETAKRLGIPVERTLDLGNGVKLELVLIPAGRFIMGTPEPEPTWIGGTILGTAGLVALVLLAVLMIRAVRLKHWPQYSLRWLILLVAVLGVAQYGGFRWWRAAEAWKSFNADESPAHEVTLSRPYYMGKYEVTQEQYEQVMGRNPSGFTGRDLPVEQVQWMEAQDFFGRIGKKTGESVRFPSEAEWEFACRAGTRTTYYTGDAETDLDRAGWYIKNSKGATHPVGQKTPNAWGVYDMHGNVWEWCADFHANYGAEAVMDPQCSSGGIPVVRGGAYIELDSPRECRSASRNDRFHDVRRSYLGFRVVVSPRTP